MADPIVQAITDKLYGENGERLRIGRVLDEYNAIREKCCRAAKENRGELMGEYAWLSATLSEDDITLEWCPNGIQCYGSTYTTQTWDHEQFDFVVPWDRL